MNAHGINIRPAVIDDLSEITELVKKYWDFEQFSGFSNSKVEQCLRTLLNSPSLGTIWVAVDRTKLCGYLVAAHIFSLEYGGPTAEIDEFFVLPEYRASGLGNAMLTRAEQKSMEQGCVHIQLQLGRTNQTARHFYLRHGYKERSGYELLDKAL